MSEAENVPIVIVGALVLAMIVIGMLIVGAIPGLNSTQQNSNLQIVCTQYQAEFGCDSAACTTVYDANKCKTLLDSASVSTKDKTISLWEMCQTVGLTDPKNCHVRCCGESKKAP